MPNDDSVAAEARRARMQARLSLTALARKFDELAGVLLHDAGELGRIWRRGLFSVGRDVVLDLLDCSCQLFD